MAKNKVLQAEINLDTKKYEQAMKKASSTTVSEGNKTSKAFEQLANDADDSLEDVEDSTEKVSDSAKDMASAISDVSSSVESDLGDISSATSSMASDVISDTSSVIDAESSMESVSGGVASSMSSDAGEIGSAFDSLESDMASSTDSMQEQLEKTKKTASDFAEEAKSMGDTLTKAVTLPVMGAVGAVGVVGTTYQDAKNTIRIGTGAIGDDLEALLDVFDKVDKQVPNSKDVVASAVADINTRLGLTGDELEALAIQVMNMEKLTGVSSSSIIDSSSKMLDRWKVEAKDYAKTLDYVFKVAQAVGTPVDELMKKVTGERAVMIQLGYTLEDTISLTSKLEDVSMDLSKVTSVANKAFMALNDKGCTDLNKGFKDIVSSITNAGSATEKQTIAMEWFGKSWSDAVEVIDTGVFSLDDFTSSVMSNGESINGLTDETRTFMDSLAIIMKELSSALEPLGSSLVDAMESMLPHIEKAIDWVAGLVNWFNELSPATQSVIIGFIGFMATLGPLMSFLGSLGLAFMGLNLVMSPTILTVGGIALAIGALIGMIALIIANWDDFCAGAVQTFELLIGGITWVVETVLMVLGNLLKGVAGIGYGLLKLITLPFEIGFNSAKEILSGFIEHVKLCIDFVKALFTGDFAECSNIVEKMFENVKETVSSVFSGAVDIVKNSIDKMKSFFDFDWSLPKFKLPHFNFTGSFSLNPLSVPKMSVDWYSSGGIFTKPTILPDGRGVGDGFNGMGSNAEAILPIDKLPSLLGLDGQSRGGLEVNIGEFVNNTGNDIEQLANELAFYMRRKGAIA